MDTLIVEDQADWGSILLSHVRTLGHSAELCSTKAEALTAIRNTSPSILLTDAALPDGNMLDEISNIRRRLPGMGIIVLTAKVRVQSHLQGLSEGADYYLTKPISLPMLSATFTALERRLATVRTTLTQNRDLENNIWRFYTTHGILRSAHDEIGFTEKESVVFSALANSPKFPISHSRLSGILGYPPITYDQHRIDALVYRVRKKLALIPGEPIRIRNIYAEGFLLTFQQGIQCILVNS